MIRRKALDPKLLFPRVLEAEGLPAAVAELRFAPPRRFRFDYSWPESKIALECDGGVWTNGRHTRGAGFLKDHEKTNLAALNGWRVLKCTPATLCSESTIAMLREVLPQKRGK